MSFEVITMGRLGIDLYPLQSGLPLGSVTSFGRFMGGSAANVAVAAARHGHRTALISRTGADDFGRFLREELERLGVSSEYVSTVADLPTPITFCEIHPPDYFPITFYRYPKAPDMMIEATELDEEAIAATDLFWITTTGLSDEPSGSAHHEALRMRGRAGLTVLDLDYREAFWESVAVARGEIAKVLPAVNVVVGNLTECEVATGLSDPHEIGHTLMERGLKTVIVKLGPEGVLGFDSQGVAEVPPVEVEVVNGLGAGDAFGGALCHGLLAGWPLEQTLKFANTAGAIVASRLECSTAMPYTDEVLSALSER
ncbi:MAG TPA: 5-dehydro-2-deoxygluconokinase [Acidimicrobiia bacterium]|nr:5-dehydro-2-deoxygluconokinase [Acidimicrobiia bacterium]